MASSIANSSIGGPSLDLGNLSSAAHYGSSLGTLNRSLGLSVLSPVTESQNSRVEDYLAKVCAVINRQSVMVIMREFIDRPFYLNWAIFISIASWFSLLLLDTDECFVLWR